MGVFDKVIKGSVDMTQDIVKDASNGDGVGVAVELVTNSIGASNWGDVAQEQIKVFGDAVVDGVQGEEVSLEYDPEFIPTLAEAGMEDAGTVLEIYTGG